ncbi:MAG: OsmC family protein [Vulcanimicrobiaceae bacterium]
MPALHHEHVYRVGTTWTGNRGAGTSGYRAYGRDSEIVGVGKASSIDLSADPAFRGDATRYNPEELLVASLSSCHMLWYLHLCAEAGVVVTAYRDDAAGRMVTYEDGSGEFVEVVLNPHVTIADQDRAGDAAAIHERAHHMCFIARSMKFPVTIEARIAAA